MFSLKKRALQNTFGFLHNTRIFIIKYQILKRPSRHSERFFIHFKDGNMLCGAIFQAS